jgi:hypothetical protein
MGNPSPDPPRSLLADENRLYIERVSGLFAAIRRDCDAKAVRYGFAAEDDGLAAVEYIANRILAEVRTERDARRVAKPPTRKSGPHESTRRFVADWTLSYEGAKLHERTTAATLRKWIAEVDRDLERGKTKSKTITFSEAEAIRDYRDTLQIRLNELESRKAKRPTIGEVKTKLAERFVARDGRPRQGKDALSYIEEKLKRSSRSLRGKKRPK